MKTHGYAAIAFALLAGLAGEAEANLITNGDFNGNTTAGWTTGGSACVGAAGNAVVFGCGEVGPGSFLTQAFGTTAGTGYALEFDYGAFPFLVGPQQMTVTVRDVLSNALLFSQVYNDPDSDLIQYTHYSASFTAIGANSRLTFTDTSASSGGVDGWVDNVSVSNAPLPGTLALLAIGLAGFGTLRRSRI